MATELLRELMQAALAASAAIVLLQCLRRPLRARFGAGIAYRAWLLVPVAMLAVWLPAASAPVAPAAQAGVMWIGQAGWSGRVGAALPSSSNLVLLAWCLGALLALVGFAARQHGFSRQLARRPGRGFDIVDGHGPAVIGWWRSRIVLPRDFRERYSRSERRLVLAHEIAHLRAGDLHAQLLVTALRCLFWFNPLVHLAAAQFRFDQELACDAAVLARFPRGRGRYGSAMLKTQLAGFGLPVGCHWQSRHPLKERIEMLKQPLPARTRRMAGTALVAMIVGGGTWAAWAAQPASAGKPAPAAEYLTSLTSADRLAPPKWPQGVKEEGSVVIELLVGTDGKVKEVKVVRSTPAGVFDQAAIDSTRTWYIHPALENGTPVEKRWRTQIDFSLHGEPSAEAGKG